MKGQDMPERFTRRQFIEGFAASIAAILVGGIPPAEAKPTEPKKTPNTYVGKATYYGPDKDCLGCSENEITRSGEPLDPDKETAACNLFDQHEHVRIKHLGTGAETTVRINDTGGGLAATPNELNQKPLIDLTRAAADDLGFDYQQGAIPVEATLTEPLQ